MVRRSGTTLIEVLVAIFVMGIGLIALLVLFPLGALRMTQAIQDEHCAEAAANADAIATMQNVRTDPKVINDGIADVFNDPGAFAGLPLPKADPEGASYPVLVDPIGTYATAFLAPQDWLAGDPNSLVRRRFTSFANPFDPKQKIPADLYRWFGFLEDLRFDATGHPPAPVTRDFQYSWTLLLQRPRSADPSIVTCSVVVYNRRPLTSATTLNEFVYSNRATFDTTRNVITIDFTGLTPPPVRAGDWILDSTLDTSKKPMTPHGFFYRVVGVNELSNTSVEFEVQTPLRGFANTQAPIKTGPGTFQGTVVVFEGIAEVFERGPGRNPN